MAIVDDATAPSGTGKITRLTHTATGTTVAWQDLAVSEAEGTIAATPSTPYQAGIWVRASAALNVMLSLQGLTAANTSAGSLNSPASVLTPGQWTLLTVEGTSSANVTKYRVDLDAGDAIAYPAGVTLDIDACIIGEQPYFDGSRIPGPVV